MQLYKNNGKVLVYQNKFCIPGTPPQPHQKLSLIGTADCYKFGEYEGYSIYILWGGELKIKSYDQSSPEAAYIKPFNFRYMHSTGECYYGASNNSTYFKRLGEFEYSLDGDLYRPTTWRLFDFPLDTTTRQTVCIERPAIDNTFLVAFLTEDIGSSVYD